MSVAAALVPAEGQPELKCIFRTLGGEISSQHAFNAGIKLENLQRWVCDEFGHDRCTTCLVHDNTGTIVTFFSEHLLRDLVKPDDQTPVELTIIARPQDDVSDTGAVRFGREMERDSFRDASNDQTPVELTIIAQQPDDVSDTGAVRFGREMERVSFEGPSNDQTPVELTIMAQQSDDVSDTGAVIFGREMERDTFEGRNERDALDFLMD